MLTMKREIFCTILGMRLLRIRLSLGSIFVSMDYTSIEEHLTKLKEKGEEELNKLKEEKATMQKELDVELKCWIHEVDDQSKAVRSFRRSCCSGLTVHCVVCFVHSFLLGFHPCRLHCRSRGFRRQQQSQIPLPSPIFVCRN